MKSRAFAACAGALLLLWAVVLHGVFFVCAGGLWRDEANSVNQANLATWGDLLDSLHYDSFPLLYPALLRAWSYVFPEASDTVLRLLGLSVGIALIVSVLAAARLAGVAWPWAALLLVAAGPLFIREGDSLRPYGVGFVCLAWSFGLLAKSLATGSAGWIAAATLACTLSVQTSYANSAHVGVLTLCAVAAHNGGPAGWWKLLVPGCGAALSLLPYVGVVRRAAEWAGLVRQTVDWPAFASRFLTADCALHAAPWVGFAFFVLPALSAARGTADPLRRYFGFVLFAVLPAQLLLLELLGVPLFPRYFLPALLLLALSLDGLAGAGLRRPIFALMAASVLALPSWTALRQRRTNTDVMGAALSAVVDARDLVLVSPWFLHPSFQRYYHGRAVWATVPELPAAPMMRYDLVKRAMLERRGLDATCERIRTTLDREGTLWLVTQRHFRSSPAQREQPQAGAEAGGSDYVHFRSYWEDGVEHALASCCVATPLTDGTPGSVDKEEDLVVIRWTRTQ